MSTITEIQVMETLQLRLPSNFVNPTGSASAFSKRNKIRLDPLRALEPARKKLSNIESQRIASVIDDTKRKCEIVTALPYVLQNLEKFAATMGVELTVRLTEHKKLYEKFVNLELRHTDVITQAETAYEAGEDVPSKTPQNAPTPPSSRPTSRNLSSRGSTRYRQSSGKLASLENSEQVNDLMTQIKTAELELQISMKNLMRYFGQNPGVVNMLLEEVGSNKSRECGFFVTQLSEIKEILMEKLLMTPIEEKEKTLYLSQVSAQERSNAVVIDKLEEELRIANEGKDYEIRLKNDIIRKLQNDLHILEKATEEEIKRMKTEAEKQEAADTKNSEGKKQKLSTEFGELKAKLDNLTSEHREEEQNLRKKKYKLETEVENWIQKYDQDMGEKQTEYEEIDGVYTEEKRQLHELEERFATLEEEYKKITEARNKAKEERETAERQLALMVRAATTIQAFWRSFKVRKALKQKNKKGKKGKKK